MRTVVNSASSEKTIMISPGFMPMPRHEWPRGSKAEFGYIPLDWGRWVTCSAKSNVLDLENSRWADLAIVVRRRKPVTARRLARLVEQFQPTVYAIALRRLGNPTDALELTQEVFLHVLQRIGQLREPERFAGWLRQVAVRMAINRATRRVAPASVDAGVLEGACEGGDEPLEQLISRERAERLWECARAAQVAGP